MKETRAIRNIAVGAVCVLLLSLTAAAADNWIGAWKLNLAKSKFSPGPAPKSQTLKFEAQPGGFKLTSEQMDTQGKPAPSSYSVKYDGKDHAWTGNPNADTTMIKRVDDNHYDSTWKKGGKVTIVSKVAVSADGKTLTITQTGTDAAGKPVNNTLVFER